MTVDVALLLLIVFVAFSVEAALGFGAAVVTLTGASFLMPTRELLATLVPLNLTLSVYILIKASAHLDAGLVLRRLIGPTMIGLPVGFVALAYLGERNGKILFGVFVTVLAIVELVAHARTIAPRALPRLARVVLLFGAGIIHGAFATGGPLLVYVASRELPDKNTFRASLSLVWVILNVLLFAAYAWDGLVTVASFRLAAWLVPGVIAGALAGNWLFGRFSAEVFKRLVFALLAVSGVVIALRAALAT